MKRSQSILISMFNVLSLNVLSRPLLGLVVCLTAALSVGCSSTPPAAPGQPPNNPPTDGACANILRGSIELPTTLVNTASACDYLLEGELRVRSTLKIEPGVVVRTTLSSRIVVEEADLLAVGTPEQRIVFAGQDHAQGYWGGIYLNDARPSRIEHVDIKDAGQTCDTCQGGLRLRKTVVSLIDSSVSNSFVHGLSIDREVDFTAFANNRFYGNAFAGVETKEARVIPQFDAASDYLGLETPNTQPYVQVTASITDVGEHVWEKLNAPYYIEALLVKDGTLVLEPGVEMVIADEKRPKFLSKGSLKAIGKASDPIIFRGEKAQREYWSGLWFEETGSRQHVLEHVHIRDSWTGLFLKYGVDLKISNSRVENSTNGITCDILLFQDTVLELGPNVTFETTNREVDEDCYTD